jgi:AraC-like DNA-binding protein
MIVRAMPTEPLPLLDAALRGATLALLLLLAASLLRLPRRLPLEQLGLLLALGLCVQMLSSWPPVEATAPSWRRAPLVGLSMGNAVLFWLWVRSLCDDDFRPGARHALAWAAVALAGALNIALLLPWCIGGGPGWGWALSQAVFALPLLFALLAVAAAVAHWRDDLVERRRWLRAFIVVAGCGYTLLQIGLRRLRPDNRLSTEGAVLDLAVLLCVVAAACWMLLRPTRGDLVAGEAAASPARLHLRAEPDPQPQPAPAPAPAHFEPLPFEPAQVGPAPAPAAEPDAPPCAPPDPAEERLAAALQRAMTEQRVYKDPTLSVAGLAARLQVPEYRLRRHINQRLGQRNFNAYLNGYRLAEAKAALASPAQQHLPVLTLALEAGFGSIGPFNRAFKADTGLTPTEFRQQKLADS